MGIQKVFKHLSATCPYCNNTIGLKEVVYEVFRIIAKRLKEGKSVRIEKFGLFHPTVSKPRTYKVWLNGRKDFDDRVQITSKPRQVLRFKSAPSLRKYMNEGFEYDENNDK